MKKYSSTTEWENNFRERIRKLMERDKISARDLSLALGYNEGYISRILKCRIDPSFKAMMDIILFFDMSPAEFFSRDDL